MDPFPLFHQGTDDPNFTTRNGVYQLFETVPHDPTAFTQGLVMVPNTNDGVRLFEGTGLYGNSEELRQVDLVSGDVLDRHVLPNEYFGESIAYYQDDDGQGGIIQLTCNEQTAFIYDSDDLTLLSQIPFWTTHSEVCGIKTQTT